MNKPITQKAIRQNLTKALSYLKKANRELKCMPKHEREVYADLITEIDELIGDIKAVTYFDRKPKYHMDLLDLARFTMEVIKYVNDVLF